MKPIRKAVILAAWYGTRFLPASKSVPKEMFPILDKPIMQYVVDELVESWIEQIIFVTSSRKKAVEDYFDSDFELEQKLSMAWKDELHKDMSRIPHTAQFVYIRQKEQKGTWDAILLAKNVVGDEPFIVCAGDDIMVASPARAKQMIDAYNTYGWVILAAMHSTDPADTKKYGFAAWELVAPWIIKVDTLVEKPGANKPSDIAVVSWYVLPPEIFPALEKAAAKIGNSREIYYIDGINILKEEQNTPVYAVTIKDWKYYDCGTPLTYLTTSIDMWLQRDDIKDDLKAYIKGLNI